MVFATLGCVAGPPPDASTYVGHARMFSLYGQSVQMVSARHAHHPVPKNVRAKCATWRSLKVGGRLGYNAATYRHSRFERHWTWQNRPDQSKAIFGGASPEGS
eukprot:6481665-Amphidinium_carterae.2